jgi:hypothetical protein
LSVSGSWEPLVIMRMFVWSSEVSYINSTPFFRLKIVSTNVKTYKCTAILVYIVLKQGDIIMTIKGRKNYMRILEINSNKFCF